MAKANKLPSLKSLNKLFYYDGVDLRNKSSRGAAKKDAISGSIDKRDRTSYRLVCLEGSNFYAHRIIWKLVTGLDPEGVIDHPDGNGLNNKADNLIDTSEVNNHKNMRLSKANTSGVQGVRLRKDTGKWIACIDTGKGKSKSRSFTEMQDAINWRVGKMKELGYHPLHGTQKGE